jgi:hypothetical protein
MLAGQGRSGVVVDARPLGEADGGRQLVALRIKSKQTGPAGERNLPSLAVPPQPGPNAASSGNPGRLDGTASLAQATSDPVSAKRGDQLSAAERADLAKLQQRDQQVRQEEKAHAAVAGDLAGPISYSYQRGPDGRQYAVGGSVGVQAKAVTGDPAEAERLSGRMAAAANAPTNTSAQDFATARLAYDLGSRLNRRERGVESGSELNLKL